MEIRFSRHAKNKLRLFKLTQDDIEKAINMGEKISQGNQWESRRGKLRVIWTMVGSHAFVITVIKAR